MLSNILKSWHAWSYEMKKNTKYSIQLMKQWADVRTSSKEKIKDIHMNINQNIDMNT